MKQQIKNGFLIGLVASLTIFGFGMIYAAWDDVVTSGDPLSAASWNELVNKLSSFNFFDGKIGIGGTPTYTFDIINDNYQQIRSIRPDTSGTSIWSNELYSSSSFGPTFNSKMYRGTINSPEALINGIHFLQLTGQGYNGNQLIQSARIYMTTTEDWNTNSAGSQMSFFTTTNGSSTTTQKMLITNDGNVGIGNSQPGSKLSVVGLPTGTSGSNAGLDGTSSGAVCIMSDGDMYIDTDGVCD